MKKQYKSPQLRVVNLEQTDIICTSNPYGPNSEIIPVGGEEGDEQVAPPPPSRVRGMWNEW